MNRKQRLILEARMLNESKKYRILESKVAKYNEILNEGFFDKLSQGLSAMGKTLGRAAIPGYKGYGGATSRDLEAEIPEMKALEQGLKSVESKKKDLAGVKLSDIDRVDSALDQYVTSLVDLYTEFKDVVNNPEQAAILPGVTPKMQAAFKDGKEMLRQLQQAVTDASTKISQALKRSKLASSTITVPKRRGVVYDAEEAPDARSRPGMAARARGPLTTGGPLRGAGPTAGGLAGAGLRESKQKKR